MTTHRIALAALLCAVPGCAQSAAECRATYDCAPTEECVQFNDPRSDACPVEPGPASVSAVCVASCDASRVFCGGGSVCLDDPTNPRFGSCYDGGAVPVGEVCCSMLDCVRGAICVTSSLSQPGTCRPACEPSERGACGEGSSCEPLAWGMGACRPG